MKLSKFLSFAAVAIAIALPNIAAAHCDTLTGPVVSAARRAFAKGDVTETLWWVPKKDEPAIRRAFAAALKVRGAKSAAAHYKFYETLVRIHRTGEGEPYTGIKPAGTPVDPAIARADRAIQIGSAREVVKGLPAGEAKEVQSRFAAVLKARKAAPSSVEKGRAYVAAYVAYLHLVEELAEGKK